MTENIDFDSMTSVKLNMRVTVKSGMSFPWKKENLCLFLYTKIIGTRIEVKGERNMFQLFKKKSLPELCAVVDGLCIPLEQVNDPVFAGKALGEGIAIVPENGEVVAPCDGTLTLLTPTRHAFGMECADGLQLMVHIGIDTVALNGEGFEVMAEQGASVKKGQPIIRFDMEYMKAKNIDTTVMLIMLNHQEYSIKTLNHGCRMKKGADTAIVYCQ